jgi:hypothetical protein
VPVWLLWVSEDPSRTIRPPCLSSMWPEPSHGLSGARMRALHTLSRLLCPCHVSYGSENDTPTWGPKPRHTQPETVSPKLPEDEAPPSTQLTNSLSFCPLQLLWVALRAPVRQGGLHLSQPDTTQVAGSPADPQHLHSYSMAHQSQSLSFNPCVSLSSCRGLAWCLPPRPSLWDRHQEG